MRHRNVGGFQRFHGYGKAHDFRLHVVEAGGLGIQRDEVRRLDPAHPVFELGFREHRRVTHGRVLDVRIALIRLDMPKQTAQLQPLEQRPQPVRVRGAGFQLVQRERQLHVADDGDQLLVQGQHIQILAKPVAHGAADFVGSCDQ